MANSKELGPWVPETLLEGMRLAELLAKSELLPSALRGKPADVLIIMMKGRELGLPPMVALDSIDVIAGKAVANADLMAGLVLASGRAEYFRVTDSNDKSATIETKRRGWPDAQTYTYRHEDAVQAGLISKRNWQTDERSMLVARAKSRGARLWYPDVVRNLYTRDEADELLASERRDQSKIAETVNVTAYSVTPSADVNRGHDGAMPKVAKPEAPAPNGISKTIGPKERGLLGAESGRKSEECGVAKEIILRRALVAAGGVWSRNDLPREKMSAVLNWISAYDPTQDGAEMPVAPRPEQIAF